MSNELDKQFSDRLIGYESAVDAEALWEAVKPPPKKRPWRWLWLLLLVPGAILLSTSWWYSDLKEENAIVASLNPVEEDESTTIEKSSLAVEHQTLWEEENREAESAVSEIMATNNSSLNTNPIRSTVASGVAPTSGTMLISDASARQNATTNTTTGNSLTETAANEPNLTSTDSGSLEAAIDSEKESNSITTKELVISPTSQFEITSPVPTLDARLLPTQLNTKLPSFSSPSEESYPSKRSPWFLQLDAGYYALHRTLSTNDSIATNWLDQREQTESLLEAKSFDATLGYELSERWELRTGIAYTQINTAFNYTSSSIAIDTILGPTIRYTTTLQEKRTYNSFRQWEMPLLAACNFGAGRLSYQVEAGIRLLVRRQWEGSILSESEEFVDLAAEDWYRNTLDLNLQAGLKVKYDLTARTAILAGLSARYSPQQFTIDNAPFKERYQLLGASISLRHKF